MKNGLELCKNHRQETNQSHFDKHNCDFCKLEAEVERLRAELAQSRKDWCDDDEAIKQQALRVLAKFEVEGDSVHVPRMAELAEMMADTAICHKEECLAWMRVAQDKERELAAAKAASVCPVEVIDCYFNAMPDLGEVRLICKSGSDAQEVTNWIRERMKERSEQ